MGLFFVCDLSRTLKNLSEGINDAVEEAGLGDELGAG
jgi:hypothetical protein